MKVSIITINDTNANYGNVLQNYAAQLFFDSNNVDTITILFEKGGFSALKNIKRIMNKLTGYSLFGDKNYWKYMHIKSTNFEKFQKKYIHSKRIRSIRDIPETDYYAVGSDQVWNPLWYNSSPLRKDLFLLTFTTPEKKICLAPSFGITDLPDEWKPWFETHLKTFPKLGVREKVGAQIIAELIGQSAEVLLDPTLLISADQWKKIAKKPENVDCSKPYILTYFLGGRSEKVKKDIDRYAEIIGASIYNLLDYSQPELFVSGPAEFLYLICSARVVVTDSFHACVFSFLFRRPFLVYNRGGHEENMMSRMETLFDTFDLRRKYINSELPNEILECDYSKGYEQLKKERKFTSDFILSSIR